MSRIFTALVLLWLGAMAWAQEDSGQDFSGLARVAPDGGRVAEQRGGALALQLDLSQGVPWRAYTLSDPARLVLDFREVDWSGLDAAAMLPVPGAAQAVRFGGFRPGWSRMVLDLAGPMGIDTAQMQIAPDSGTARLSVTLHPLSAEDFAARSGVPNDPRWDLPVANIAARPRPRPLGSGPAIIVLDPGHGGIDPGAEYQGVTEKDLMLTFARELRDELRRSGGFEVVLTRDADEFVSLDRRVAIAHEVHAHAFLSLHADAVTEGRAHGATVYVLDDEASDEATRQLAERHDRDDLLSGVDLTGQDDVVAGILMDLARQETRPRTDRLAQALVDGMTDAGGPVNSRPLRRASFSVLKAADIPSVLVEVGFLSSPRDAANLANPDWRAGIAAGIRSALQDWVSDDLVRAGLRRQ